MRMVLRIPPRNRKELFYLILFHSVVNLIPFGITLTVRFENLSLWQKIIIVSSFIELQVLVIGWLYLTIRTKLRLKRRRDEVA
jgi:glycopeptide antibiotics resistance protein